MREGSRGRVHSAGIAVDVDAEPRTGVPALSVAHVSKAFGGTLALDDVSVEVHHGEVLALLGHNGSGKSTLIKILAGFHQPMGHHEAEAHVDGMPLALGSADDAKRLGLRFVHQNLGVVLELNAIDNVALVSGYIRSRSGRIDRRAQIDRTRRLLQRFEIDLDVTALLADATPVQRTAVAIVRSMWDWDQSARRVLVLDEPTAALPSREVDNLFDLVHRVREAGHCVIYVSHRMDEIFRVADRVVVLRSGRVVSTGLVADETPQHLAEVIGGEGASTPRKLARSRGPVADDDHMALAVTGLRGRYLRGADIDVGVGEIVGVAGLQGSGRDELPYLLAGAYHWGASTASWKMGGREVPPPTPATASAVGLAFIPAERSSEGLIASMTVKENLTLAALPRIRSRWRLGRAAEQAFATRWLREMGVPQSVAEQPITTLSGGNQQRVLLAKWLSTDPRVLVMSEPTAGVDVGARHAVYELLRERANRGLAVVLASSDVEDLVEVCDRVLVLRAGVVEHELRGDQIGRSNILSMMEASVG
jgi:ribose transport system ATP-binding protein